MTQAVATEKLLHSDDEELWSLLGLTTLPLTASPTELLEAGRRGAFWQAGGPPSMGGEEIFAFPALQEFGKRFLRAWKKRLIEAICTNEELQKSTNHELTVIAAIAAAALTTQIPELQPYSGAIAVLAAMVARSGAKGFCDVLQNV